MNLNTIKTLKNEGRSKSVSCVSYAGVQSLSALFNLGRVRWLVSLRGYLQGTSTNYSLEHTSASPYILYAGCVPMEIGIRAAGRAPQTAPLAKRRRHGYSYKSF